MSAPEEENKDAQEDIVDRENIDAIDTFKIEDVITEIKELKEPDQDSEFLKEFRSEQELNCLRDNIHKVLQSVSF